MSQHVPILKIALFGFARMAKAGADFFRKKNVNLYHFIPKDHLNSAEKFRVITENSNCFLYHTTKSEALLNKLKQFKPDYIMVFGLNEKIPNSVIDVCPDAAFNVHPSLLPHFRGPNPWYWVLFHGEKETGISIHKLTDSFDAGDVVASLSFPLHPLETQLSHQIQTYNHIPALLESFYPALISKNIIGKKQKEGRYFRKISTRDLLINWKQPAKAIDAHVRAATPFYSTYFKLDNKVFKCLEVSKIGRAHV